MGNAVLARARPSFLRKESRGEEETFTNVLNLPTMGEGYRIPGPSELSWLGCGKDLRS